MTANSTSRRVWITISHPGMAESDTIGDMVRMKTIRDVLESMGHRATIITSRGERADDAHDRRGSSRAARIGKAWLKAGVPRGAWATLKDLAYQRHNDRFRAMLEARRDVPDLVIDYNFYWNDAALAFARPRGIPVILNVETLVADSMPEVVRSWLRGRGEAFEIEKYRRADRLWAVSTPLAEALAVRAAIDPGAIDVVPNAAPAAVDSGTRLPGIPDDALVLGFVGGFAAWYALDRLVAAFLELRQRFPQLVLLLVGDGPERERIEGLLRSAPRGAAILTGKVPHAEVARYVARMDVCAITNHTWWSSPLKLLEYGAMGKAVVAPTLPSITTMVSPDEVRLFRAGEFHEFTAACGGLLGDADSRRRLGENLRRAVESRYSLAAMASRISASIDRLFATR